MYQQNIISENGGILILPKDPESGELQNTKIPDVYVADTGQVYPLLTTFDEGTGRKFRYCQNDNSGNVLVPARMVQQNYEHSVMIGMVPTAASIGDISVTVTLGTSAIVKDQFKNGWFNVEGMGTPSAEHGFMYQIESHPAASGSALCVFTLKRALVHGISTSRRVGVYTSPVGNIKNSSHGCKVVPANGQTYIAVGLPSCRVTQAQFFWAQYKGLATLETDSAVVMVRGQRIERGEVVDGTGQLAGDNVMQIYGICIFAGGIERCSLIALDLPEL